MLSSAEVDPASAGADVPEMAEFRRELLGKAKQFYQEFLKQDPRGAELRQEMALAHFRLGHISRMLEKPAEAEAEYGQAIAQLTALDRERPNAAYRQALANAYNWLGETLRAVAGRRGDAAKAYEQALQLQSALVAADGANAGYRQELARSYYNRGILRASADQSDATPFLAAEKDFRDAIRLLEPLAAQQTTGASQELARASNNLASLLADDESRAAEAAVLYDRAIRIHEQLVKGDPEDRQYKLELAQFEENDAELARVAGDFDRARRRNQASLALLDDLLRPAPSLGIEHADAHSVRGSILTEAGSRDAVTAYAQSLALFDELDDDPETRSLPAFHERFGDLLVNLATLARQPAADERAHRLLTNAVTHYIEHANTSLAQGLRADAQMVLDTLTRLLPELSDVDRHGIAGRYQQLQQRLGVAAKVTKEKTVK
jgi:tetratricopeptide (TPR) repeat protein